MEHTRAPRRGIIFILSAPSGAGKTTISQRALKAIGGLEASVSLTTRRTRSGEVEGVDYFFVSEEEFIRRREASELAEWARVFEASYGTPRAALECAVAAGRDILLDIDIQGARQIKSKYRRDAVTIFVLPPSFAELEGRLRKRATEDEAAIAGRLQRATEEAQAFREYDYLIINADLEESLTGLKAVVEAERLRVARLSEDFAAWKK
ncbi:MAG TPA: guanylate kinase [Candidatus Binataceae bacterium]